MIGQRRRQRKREIRVFQANVTKVGAYHDIALCLAFDHGFDVVLIQEPYCDLDQDGRRRTKTHPSYQTVNPTDNWDLGLPDVMTYVRIRPDLQPVQIRPTRSTSPAICWIQL